MSDLAGGPSRARPPSEVHPLPALARNHGRMPGDDRGGRKPNSNHGIPHRPQAGVSPERVAELRARFLAGGDSAVLRAVAAALAWPELDPIDPDEQDRIDAEYAEHLRRWRAARGIPEPDAG